MQARFYSWWQKRRDWMILLGYSIIPILLIAFIFAVIGGYIWNWSWTGVSSYTGPQVPPNQQYRPARTLWDWLQLLVVPVVLWTLGVGFSRRIQRNDQKLTNQRIQTDHEIALDSQRETLLREFIDKMADLLLDRNLTEKNRDAQRIARVRVLTLLPRLDADRKRRVLLFLYESGLLDREKTVVDVEGADFGDAELNDVDLSAARLCGVDLRRANLSDANLRRSDLRSADLRRVNFRRADLSDANFNNANMTNADFRRADLSDAVFNSANLNRANLSDVNLRRANLSNAYLSDADMSRAKLSDVDLSQVDLSRVNFSRADMSRARLSDANLTGANLSGADLWRADLSGANLSGASLWRANLSGARFNGARLSGANLSDANLADVDLSDANLSDANLLSATNITREQWEKALTLSGAMLPDGSEHS